MPDGRFRLSRRDVCRAGAFLAATGLASSGAAWAIGPGRPDFKGRESIYRRNDPLLDPTNHRLSTCQGCFGACPVRVSLEDGVMAKVDGNPFCPRVFTGQPPTDVAAAGRLRGVACARGQSRLQVAYDPFRLVRPLQRAGDRGGDAWRTLSSADAAGLLTRMVQDLVQDGRWRSGAAFFVDPRQVDRAVVLGAFADAFGSDRPEIHLGDPQPWLLDASTRLVGQEGWRIAPRWERAGGLLAWGADPLSSGPDPMGQSAAILGNTLRKRMPIVVVDPRMSEIAGHADLWLPVRPGGDRALAWMLLRAWADVGFPTASTDWFQPVLRRNLVELEQAAGVGWGAAREAVRLLSACGSGLVVCAGGGVGEGAEGGDAVTCVLGLAAVAGATGPGGAMEPRPVLSRPGLRPQDALVRRITQGRKADLLVVVGDGGLVDTPDWPRIRAFLADPERVAQLVVVTTAMNPVAALADLVLPDVTELERRGVAVREDGVSLVQAVVPPLPAASGLEAPFDAGFDGVLATVATAAGTSFSADTAVQAAIDGLGPERSRALLDHGWIPPQTPAESPPVADPAKSDAWGDLGSIPSGLVYLTWRESFAGFTDASYQYWSKPSLRRRNEVQIHPSTAAGLGLVPHGRLRIGEALIPANQTEEIRPGILALAVGYGHTEGYDGRMAVDGQPVVRDRRRSWGTDAGSLFTEDRSIQAKAEPPAPARSLWELLTHAMEGQERT